MSTFSPTTAPTAPLPQPRPGALATFLHEERTFMVAVATLLVAIGVIFPHAEVARWVGFALAGYSAVANDSIQTIGTFIASNRGKPWWLLWLFIGGIFLLTVTYSWWVYDGDVTYQRLASKGFETTPASFGYLQIAAPVVLLILTRARIPVSTTFLLLSCFATDPGTIGKVLTKSVAGYGVAFVAAIVVWFAVSRTVERFEARGPAHPAWRVGQWCTTGILWSVWLMQDASNIAVYLPRSLSAWELGAFAGVVFVGLGLLFKFGGARVQRVVDEKSRVVDVRSATVIDLVYAVILYLFKVESQIPMSTTWVFVGLLAGREIAMALRNTTDGGIRPALKLMGKDLLYVSIGLAVSVGLAVAVNGDMIRF
jgi:hypothetical protein